MVVALLTTVISPSTLASNVSHMFCFVSHYVFSPSGVVFVVGDNNEFCAGMMALQRCSLAKLT